MRIEPVVTRLPADFAMLRAEARAEEHKFLDGIARSIAVILLHRAVQATTVITVNAAPASIGFSEQLGFLPDGQYGHTHVMRLSAQ